MRRAIVALVCLVAVACGSSAKELLDTAQFEELQRNTTHARELYRQIVDEHPGSPEAAKATERLAALDAAQ